MRGYLTTQGDTQQEALRILSRALDGRPGERIESLEIEWYISREKWVVKAETYEVLDQNPSKSP